jgi:hypothetical protein
VSGRLRSIVLGLALGVAPLLLLDLAIELARVADATTAWWAIGAYALIGATLAIAIGHARRDPLIPGVAAVVLLLAVAPGLPQPLDGLPLLPVIGEVAVRETPVIVVLIAACAVGGTRSRRT